MKSQTRKGMIELCALALLQKKDYYGYDLSTIISEKIDIADGTIYPVLRKLKTEGLVTTYITEGQGGPPRKYYQITRSGKQAFQVEKDNWYKLVHNINELLEVIQ